MRNQFQLFLNKFRKAAPLFNWRVKVTDIRGYIEYGDCAFCPLTAIHYVENGKIFSLEIGCYDVAGEFIGLDKHTSNVICGVADNSYDKEDGELNSLREEMLTIIGVKP
jgi:hypothetical protein